MLYSMIPLARTPADKKSAQAMQKHSDSIRKTLDGLHKEDKYKQYLRRKKEWQRQGRQIGEMVVVLDDAAEAGIPLFEGVKKAKNG